LRGARLSSPKTLDWITEANGIGWEMAPEAVRPPLMGRSAVLDPPRLVRVTSYPIDNRSLLFDAP